MAGPLGGGARSSGAVDADLAARVGASGRRPRRAGLVESRRPGPV